MVHRLDQGDHVEHGRDRHRLPRFPVPDHRPRNQPDGGRPRPRARPVRRRP
jgi:hypothetical protein